MTNAPKSFREAESEGAKGVLSDLSRDEVSLSWLIIIFACVIACNVTFAIACAASMHGDVNDSRASLDTTSWFHGHIGFLDNCPGCVTEHQLSKTLYVCFRTLCCVVSICSLGRVEWRDCTRVLFFAMLFFPRGWFGRIDYRIALSNCIVLVSLKFSCLLRIFFTQQWPSWFCRIWLQFLSGSGVPK